MRQDISGQEPGDTDSSGLTATLDQEIPARGWRSLQFDDDLIYRVFFDHAGTLWVTTNDGLNRFDPRTEKFKVFKADWNNGLSQSYPSIAEDPTRNVLWLGSLHSGLHRLDLATGQIKIYRSILPIFMRFPTIWGLRYM